jgi:hypothetical protein
MHICSFRGRRAYAGDRLDVLPVDAQPDQLFRHHVRPFKRNLAGAAFCRVISFGNTAMANHANHAAALLVEHYHLTQNVTLCITEFSRLSTELNRRNPIRSFRGRCGRIRWIKSCCVSNALNGVGWRLFPLSGRIRHAF